MNRRDFLRKCASVTGGFLLSNPAFKINIGATHPRIVLLIGWDGAQRNHVHECLGRGELPNLKKLGSEGTIVDIDIIGGKTDTKAGWAEILTGYEPEVTGVYNNSNYQPIPVGLTVFERLEEHFGPNNIVTLAVIGKADHVGGGPGLPYYYTKDNMDLFENSVGPDNVVGPRAIELLEQYKNQQIFFFTHFRNVDSYGHNYGENSKEYNDALISNDFWTGKIIEKVSDKIVIAITGDHTTPISVGEHQCDPVPIVFWSNFIRPDSVKRFSEIDAAAGALHTIRGIDVMPLLLGYSGYIEKFGA